MHCYFICSIKEDRKLSRHDWKIDDLDVKHQNKQKVHNSCCYFIPLHLTCFPSCNLCCDPFPYVFSCFTSKTSMLWSFIWSFLMLSAMFLYPCLTCFTIYAVIIYLCALSNFTIRFLFVTQYLWIFYCLYQLLSMLWVSSHNLCWISHHSCFSSHVTTYDLFCE